MSSKDIGLGIEAPSKPCNDMNCPFHGILPVRGRLFEGIVVSIKMNKTIIIKRDFLNKIKKYQRYERRNSRIPAHLPPCLDSVEVGMKVRIGECRPLSKTVSFVCIGIIEKKQF